MKTLIQHVQRNSGPKMIKSASVISGKKKGKQVSTLTNSLWYIWLLFPVPVNFKVLGDLQRYTFPRKK